MTFYHTSILLIWFVVILALGWDVAMMVLGVTDASFSNAAKDMNVRSNGLFALFTLAVWLHIFVFWNVWK
jgi:hypothetical protein